MKLKLLGMDPSFSNWGLAAMLYDTEARSLSLAKLDVIQPPKDNSKQVRKSSQDLARAEYLFEKVMSYMPYVDAICIEVPHGSQNARASLGAGACIGLIAAIRNSHGAKPVICVNATETRMEITGKASATKQQGIDWASGLYPDANWPKLNGQIIASKAEHMADAVAAVHAGIKTETFKMLTMLATKD